MISSENETRQLLATGRYEEALAIPRNAENRVVILRVALMADRYPRLQNELRTAQAALTRARFVYARLRETADRTVDRMRRAIGPEAVSHPLPGAACSLEADLWDRLTRNVRWLPQRGNAPSENEWAQTASAWERWATRLAAGITEIDVDADECAAGSVTLSQRKRDCKHCLGTGVDVLGIGGNVHSIRAENVGSLKPCPHCTSTKRVAIPRGAASGWVVFSADKQVVVRINRVGSGWTSPRTPPAPSVPALSPKPLARSTRPRLRPSAPQPECPATLGVPVRRPRAAPGRRLREWLSLILDYLLALIQAMFPG